MRIFFVDPKKITGNKAILDNEEAHHAKHVLRLAPGDQIRLFDGTGKIYESTIESLNKNNLKANIVNETTYVATGPELHLCQGLLTGKKMDLVVQKANELGVTSVQPFVSAHCTARKQSFGKIARWEKIILESCKQCCRPIPMNLKEPMDFNELVARKDIHQFDGRYIFWEHENKTSLSTSSIKPDNSEDGAKNLVVIGPEGGFSLEEINLARRAGFKTLSLGNRTLRAETATISVIAIMQFLLGNLSPSL